MRIIERCLLAIAIVVVYTGVAGADGKITRTWSFDRDATGQIAAGFTGAVGTWMVVVSDNGQALAQLAKNPDETFNIALCDETQVKDVDISVRMKAIAGQEDQGGGIVWRAKDAKNYYLAHYNPLEDNYRFYTVIDGKRTQLANADIKHSPGWHTLRITMVGDHVECYYDGMKVLDQTDGPSPRRARLACGRSRTRRASSTT